MLPHTASSVTSNHRPPSAKDIPPVTLTNIPHVDPVAFNSYLSQIGTLYDAFQRAKAEADGASSLLRESHKKDELGEAIERGLRAVQTNTSSVPKPLESRTAQTGPSQPRRRASGGKRIPPAVTPLSTIPNVYFEDSFRLENPRTFDIVTERSEVVRPSQEKGNHDIRAANGSLDLPQPPGRKALATNAILQEKLSWYMDTVEVHLITSISTASTSFFAALGSLRELHSEASESVAKIKALRDDLSALDQQMAVGGLTVVGMKRRRENLRKLTNATDQLQCVVMGLSHCDELVDDGELDLAISRLDVVERVVSGTLEKVDQSEVSWLHPPLPPAIIDLRSLKALDGVAGGIDQLKFRIGKGFEARFLETLLVDLRQHVKGVSSQDTLRRWTTASQRSRGDHTRSGSVLPAYLRTSDQFRSDLKMNLVGLSTSKSTGPAASAFRDAIVREMKVLIRQYLPSSTDDDAESVTSVSTRSSRAHSQQDRNSILARNLRAMDPADAEQFFVNIYTDIGEALRRLSIQVKVLLDVTSGVGTPPLSGGGLRSPPRSPSSGIGSIDNYLNSKEIVPNPSGLQEELMQVLDMSSLLGQAVDAAQIQITKLLKVRSESTMNLPLDRFLRYFNLNKLFADECETISGRSGAALKGVVNSHINDYVSRFGEIERQELIRSMDSDRWEPKDFDSTDGAVLQRILQGMTSDPEEWWNISSVLTNLSRPTNGLANSDTNGASRERSKNPIPAIVDEERYMVSESAAIIIRGIDRFETLLAVIPSMTSEISSSLCDYLKLFNSRLCQLILGAGAIHSAGLKNINTKHLAMASQTLSFVIAVLPYVRECARRHASGKPPLAEFDNVKRLLQDQQVSIHDKLIDIMSNRASVHVRNLQKITWDDDVKNQVSPNMETLAKETITLHKVISKFLSEPSVRMIMIPVFESYKEQLGKVFRDATVTTAPGKERYVHIWDPLPITFITNLRRRLLRDARFFSTKLGQLDAGGDTGPFLEQLIEAKMPAQHSGVENGKEEGVPDNAASGSPSSDGP